MHRQRRRLFCKGVQAFLDFLPDGSAISVARYAVARLNAGSPSLEAVYEETVSPVEWKRTGRGHVLGYSCAGLVVAEYFDAKVADEIRSTSTEVIL